MLGGFNQMPFNRAGSIEIYGSFEIDAIVDVFMIANVEASGGFELDCEVDVIFDAVREQFAQFAIDATADIEFNGIRERYGQFEVIGDLEVTASAGRYHVDFIEFKGNFKPGDRIEIDSNTLKMTLNGQNALHMMQGDFFDLNTGTNELVYTDNQSGRSVRIRVTHKDKFV